MATKPPVDPNLAAALAQVKAMVAPQQDALLAQKQKAAEDARNQGIGLQAAYAAAAAQAAPLAGQIGDTYSQTAGAQAAFAKGFSDHIQQALGQSADQANELLAQNGSPQHIDAPNVSDVLYGLGGYQPATLLNTSGAAFKTAAQQYPDTLRGLGLQGYEQAQAQGAVNQRSIQDKIDELNATRPQLVQQTLSGLQDAAERRREFNLDYRLRKQASEKPQIVGSAEGGYYAVSPDGKSLTQIIAGTGPAPVQPIIVGTDGTGRYVWDRNTGTFTPVPGPLGAPPSKQPKARFTSEQIADFKNKAATAAKFAYTGEKDPDTGEWLSEPQHYQTALATMIDHGIPLGIAQQALNRYWKKPGFDFDVEQRKQGKFVPARATKGLGRPLKSFQQRNPGKAGAAAEPAAAVTPDGAKQTAFQIASSQYGWGDADLAALETLWNGESGWNYKAKNPSSGALGIPQALGHKLPADYARNPVTQIKWGLDYIKQRYGSPSRALAFWQSNNPHWY